MATRVGRPIAKPRQSGLQPLELRNAVVMHDAGAVVVVVSVVVSPVAAIDKAVNSKRSSLLFHNTTLK
jgi:hypothetical protein